MTLNEKLKARRLALGLTLEDVGNYVGVGTRKHTGLKSGYILGTSKKPVFMGFFDCLLIRLRFNADM